MEILNRRLKSSEMFAKYCMLVGFMLSVVLVLNSGCEHCDCKGDYPHFNEQQKRWLPDIQAKDKKFLFKNRFNLNDTVIHEMSFQNDTITPNPRYQVRQCDYCPRDKSIIKTYQEDLPDRENPLSRFSVEIMTDKGSKSVSFVYKDPFHNTFAHYDDTQSSIEVRGKTYENIYVKKLDTPRFPERYESYPTKIFFSKQLGLVKYEDNEGRTFEWLGD